MITGNWVMRCMTVILHLIITVLLIKNEATEQNNKIRYNRKKGSTLLEV